MSSFMVIRKVQTVEENYNVNKYGVLSINWLYRKHFEQLRA
jgi:hypothetical protein